MVEAKFGTAESCGTVLAFNQNSWGKRCALRDVRRWSKKEKRKNNEKRRGLCKENDRARLIAISGLPERTYPIWTLREQSAHVNDGRNLRVCYLKHTTVETCGIFTPKQVPFTLTGTKLWNLACLWDGMIVFCMLGRQCRTIVRLTISSERRQVKWKKLCDAKFIRA